MSLPASRSPGVFHGGEVARECVDPHVYRVLRIVGHRYTPGQPRPQARDGQVLEWFLQRFYHVGVELWRLDRLGMGSIVLNERGLEGRESELVVLLFLPFDPGPRCGGDVVLLAVLISRLDLTRRVESLVGDGVPARVLAFVD